MRVILASLAVAMLFASPAEARRHRTSGLHPECNITMPCEPYTTSRVAVRQARLKPAGQVKIGRSSERPVAARASKSLDGVVPELAEKVREIVSTCGSEIWSAVRHTRVAGTRIMSLHASGRAVDLHGNPSCIYALLRGWPGGYSTDYGRVNHVHVSYGGREHGARFAHGGGRRHYARRTRIAAPVDFRL